MRYLLEKGSPQVFVFFVDHYREVFLIFLRGKIITTRSQDLLYLFFCQVNDFPVNRFAMKRFFCNGFLIFIFSLGTITNYSGTQKNMAAWKCFTYRLTTSGDQILCSTISKYIQFVLCKYLKRLKIYEKRGCIRADEGFLG